MSILLVGYSKIKTNMDIPVDPRVSFDDTDRSQYPSEEEWAKLCSQAEANFFTQATIYTQNEFIRKCALEKARLDCIKLYDARANLSQDGKQHVWNTTLTRDDVNALIAEQVMKQG